MEENYLIKAEKLLMVGGSSGSMEIVLQFLPDIKKSTTTAIVIILHRKSYSDSSLIELFSSRTDIKVKEADEKEVISPGVIYVASADYHLLIEADKTFSLDSSEKINYSRPSIDVSFETAADAYKDKLACLLLSGANADGAEGLVTVKELHGVTAVQEPGTASVAFMPQYALHKIKPDFILKPSDMTKFINDFAS